MKLLHKLISSPFYAHLQCQQKIIPRIFILYGILTAGCETQVESERDTRPNIVIIMADDLGYSDIGCYGGEIHTPNLDKLAENGLRFQRFYNAARCCPTRASLLTGLYPHEAGMGGMVSALDSDPEPGPYQGYLDESTVTIAEVLKKAGYATYMSGKWHVGEKQDHWPVQRGFDRYFGLISGGSSYFELDKDTVRKRQMALDNSPWEPPVEGFYMTDAFSSYGEQFIREHFDQQEEKPFLLYLSYTAPHWPLHALPEDIQKYEGKYDKGWDELRDERYERMQGMGIVDATFRLSPREEGVSSWQEVENKADWSSRMEVYAAMVHRMDEGIGKVVNTLKSHGVLDNTLIFFLSDNGASPEEISGRKMHDPSSQIGHPGSYVAYKKPWAIASNTPFRRYKRWLEEGGMVTPMIAHWPQGISQKGITKETGHVVDLMATCIELAETSYPEYFHGKSIKPMRGKSLAPVFKGEELDKNRDIFWEHFGHQAMRRGDWKIISKAPEFEWELFDLSQDPTELTEIGAKNPEVLEEMTNDYANWAEKVGVKYDNN